MIKIFRRLFMTLLALSMLLPGLHGQDNYPLPPPTGMLELPSGEIERLLENFAVWEASPTREALPTRVVNSQYLPKVGSQGSLGICGSYVIYYYLYSYYFAKARELGERPDPVTSPQYIFSPAWGVLMAPHGVDIKTTGWHIPEGASPLQSIESIVKIGALPWCEMPYSDDQDKEPENKFYRQLPTAAQMKTALHYKGMRGTTLNGIDTAEGLQNLKQFLAQGNIAVAIWNSPLTANFDSYFALQSAPEASNTDTDYVEVDGIGKVYNVNNNVYAWPSATPGRNPGHAVTIVGYDDTITYRNKAGQECQGALLIVNSWGSERGISPAAGLERGFMWLGYEVVLNHKKLSGQVYSIAARSEDYQPLLLGTLQFQDLTENNWLTQIMGYPVRWPSLLNSSANGRPLGIDFPSNVYITKSNTAQPDVTEYLFDLSILADNPFPALTLQTSLITPDAVGKISGLKIEHRALAGDAWTESSSEVPEVDFTVQHFSSSYPTFTARINMLQERDIGLGDLHPQAGSSAWADANGDGFPDLAIASIQKKSDGTLENIHRVYLNSREGDFQANPITVPLPDSAYIRSGLSGLLWVDIDNDGDLDIVASNGAGTHIFKNNGQAVFTLSNALPYPGGPGAVACGDFDLDGRPDLALAGTSETGTVILFQTSLGSFTAYTISTRGSDNSGFGVFAPTLAVGDIDGDGLPDLIASGKDSGGYQILIWYQNNGNYTFTPQLLPLPAMPHFSIAIADFDGDSCDDILYSAGSQNGLHLNGILQGRSEGLPEPTSLQSGLPPLWGGRVLWADLNNDGLMEAVISGIENNGFTFSSSSYGELDRYPRDQFYSHYTRVLTWNNDEKQFQDSGMTLPSTVGFAGPSILSAVDFDNDGDIDLLSGGVLTSKANFYTAQGPNADICSLIFLENRARGYFGTERVNTPPAVPTGLTSIAQGDGKITFSWTPAADDSTPAGILRYQLQAGTTPGQYHICSGNTPAGLHGQLLKPSITLQHLPTGSIYWRVRAIDASSMMSAWSEEQTVTASGSEDLPPPSEPLPEVPPPEVTVTVNIIDTNGGTAGGYVIPSGGSIVASSGSTILLKASPRFGWRFSHWEGDVYSPLARKTKMLIFSDAVVAARFVPDRSLLHTAASHSALRDHNGHIWAWSGTYSDAKTGPAWLQGQDGLPALAAADAASWLEVNDARTFYGINKGEYDTAADNDKNFLRDSLMTVPGLDGFSWWPYPAYPEKTLSLWAGGSSYIANHLGTYQIEYDEITFCGAAQALYPFTTWTVSRHDPNQINLGIAQVACTDTFVLFLTHQAGIYAVGSNDCGQLGDSTTNEYTDIAAVPGMPKFKAIAAGWDSGSQTAFSLGLDFQGRVWSWGNNDYGQLGLGYHGAGTTALSPQMLPPFSSPVIALAAGNRHALALTEDGQVFAWGDNSAGQIGSGDGNGDGILDQAIVDSPYPVPGLGSAFCIAAAASHSLAINDAAELFGWGNNADGQISGRSSADLWSPTLVPNAPKHQGSSSNLTTAVRSSADAPGSSISYPGMGSVIPPAGTYASRAGSTLEIEAVDGERYQFSHWEGPVADTDSPVTTVLIGADLTEVCAVFAQVGELMLTIAADPETSGSTLPSPDMYTLTQNSIHTFQALPKPHYTFKQWDSVTDLGNKAQQSQFDWTLTGDLNLTAQFELRPFRTTPKPNIDGTSLSLTENGQIIWWTQKVNSGGSTGYIYTQHTLDLGGVQILDVVDDGLALGNNGRLYAWGRNASGERGTGATSSDYTSPDAYNLVLGPDGQDFFTDAVKIFASNQTRFALRAEGSLYIWGKMPVTGQTQSRPQRVSGLKEGNRVINIVEATESKWIADGSLSGQMVSFSTFLFLYDDGTIASWGDAEFTGTGEVHPTPSAVPGLSNIQALAAGDGLVLALRQDGRVYVWGKSYEQSYTGCLGLGENITTQIQPLLLTGLSGITSITVISRSCYAIDQDGKLYIWGNNGSWELGLGSEPSIPCWYRPTLHPDSSLPVFVSIAGGQGQVTALTANGELWKWGRNAHGYIPGSNQTPLFWPEPIRDASIDTTFNLTPLAYQQVHLRYDPRTSGLVSWPVGRYTLLDGDIITVHAASTPGMNFLEWRKNGVQFSQSPFLELVIEEDLILEAVYAIQAPVLELADTTAAPGGTAALPLLLQQAYSSYEAVDLVLRFPDSLRFRGIDREGTQLLDRDLVTYWSMPGQDTRSGQAEVRINLRQTSELFAAGDIPLANLLFELPWHNIDSYTVSISAATIPPVLSRHHGAFADRAELSNGESAVIDLSHAAVQEFSSGWLYFMPSGELPYSSLTAWLDALALQGIFISPLAWSWDAVNTRWQKTTALTANQPLLLYVENRGTASMDLQPAPFFTALQPGWNLLAVPRELPIPDDAVIIFVIGKTCCEIYSAATLQPGKLYWVFRDSDAPRIEYP